MTKTVLIKRNPASALYRVYRPASKQQPNSRPVGYLRTTFQAQRKSATQTHVLLAHTRTVSTCVPAGIHNAHHGKVIECSRLINALGIPKALINREHSMTLP